jgi:hypothetical protein
MNTIRFLTAAMRAGAGSASARAALGPASAPASSRSPEFSKPLQRSINHVLSQREPSFRFTTTAFWKLKLDQIAISKKKNILYKWGLSLLHIICHIRNFLKLEVHYEVTENSKI